MADISKPASSTTHRLAETSKERYSTLMNANGAFVEAFAQASQSYMSRLASLNEELMSFTAGRLQKNSETGESLMKCKDITDALRIQQDWLRATTEQYAQELGRVFEITAKAAIAGIQPIAEQTRHTAEEMRKAS